jgi:nucleotidyltransferase substrate binding protein (TIGR01987 family)
MPSERTALQIRQFESAVFRLKEVLALSEDAIMRDALIKRFEFTWEMAWRCLYRALRDMDIKVAEFQGPVLQAAHQAGLITDPDAWKETKECRDLTVHTYYEEVAIKVAAHVRAKAVDLFDAHLARMKALP